MQEKQLERGVNTLLGSGEAAQKAINDLFPPCGCRDGLGSLNGLCRPG